MFILQSNDSDFEWKFWCFYKSKTLHYICNKALDKVKISQILIIDGAVCNNIHIWSFFETVVDLIHV